MRNRQSPCHKTCYTSGWDTIVTVFSTHLIVSHSTVPSVHDTVSSCHIKSTVSSFYLRTATSPQGQSTSTVRSSHSLTNVLSFHLRVSPPYCQFISQPVHCSQFTSHCTVNSFYSLPPSQSLFRRCASSHTPQHQSVLSVVESAFSQSLQSTARSSLSQLIPVS